MRRAVVLAVALLATTAAAQVNRAPAGWKYDEALSRELARKAERSSVFGDVPATQTRVDAFLAPTGGSLFVTRVEGKVPADRRDAVATRVLFELIDGARRQGGAQIESSGQRADPASKLLEATITWREPAAGLRQIARTIVTADAETMIAITGECVLPLAAAKDIETACTASLATLDAGVAADQRIALAIVDAPAETALPPIATAPAGEATAPTTGTPSSSRMGDPPRLGDGGRGMAPMTIAPATREIDRRPLYLGGGIVVLAVLFWWNRRRRDRFEREDGPTTETEPEASSGDDDADDLQAAARGDTPKRDD